MSTSLTTVCADQFSMLPGTVRQEIEMTMEVIRRIDQAKSVSAGIAAEAARCSHIAGMTAGSLRRKYYAVKKRGWQALINKAKVGRKNAALAIGEHFKEYGQTNQRSSKEAYRQMMHAFREGKYFEDVGTWVECWKEAHPNKMPPVVCPHGWTPKGWTYENLMRTCGLTEYEVIASRIGRGAARDFIPSVFSTRQGIFPGAIYQFDDMWHDVRLNFGANRAAQRAIELACLDVASASRIAYGIKPRREDLDTGKLRNLTEVDMRMLLAHVLINIGYHPDGCTLVVEHGTAAVGSEFEEQLMRLSGGAIKLQRSGIISDQIHKGLFIGQPRGNFKLKAALESQHALMHTAAASLPGQIGMNRDHSPEQIYGMQQYNNQLIKAAAAMSPERAKLLRYPFLDFHQYVSAIAELYERLDWRTEHNLEGWQESGYVATEFRVSSQFDEWLPMDRMFALPPPEQNALTALIHSQPELYARCRLMSPREVWNAGKAALVRLPKSCMPMILGARLGIVRPVQSDGLITFQNAEYGPGEFRYLARDVQTPDGFIIHLQPGRDYLLHINPFCVDECFVSDKDSEAFIGLARRWQTVGKNDVEALNHQVGKQAHIEAELRAPLARRGQKLIQQKAEMHDHNARVMRGEPITPEELFRARQIEEADPDRGDFEAATSRRHEATDEFSNDEITKLFTK